MLQLRKCCHRGFVVMVSTELLIYALLLKRSSRQTCRVANDSVQCLNFHETSQGEILNFIIILRLLWFSMPISFISVSTSKPRNKLVCVCVSSENLLAKKIASLIRLFTD